MSGLNVEAWRRIRPPTAGLSRLAGVVNSLSVTTVRPERTSFSTAGQKLRWMHNPIKMCSPGLVQRPQPNDASMGGSGPSVFGGPSQANTSGGDASSYGNLPTSMQTPMGTVNNMHPIGQLQSNPQLFQPTQQTLNGFKPGLGSMRIIG